MRAKVEEVVNLLASSDESTTNPPQQQQEQQTSQKQVTHYLTYADKSPLFWQADKKGFFSPRPGMNNTSRLNAFRNIALFETQIYSNYDDCYKKVFFK